MTLKDEGIPVEYFEKVKKELVNYIQSYETLDEIDKDDIVYLNTLTTLSQIIDWMCTASWDMNGAMAFLLGVALESKVSLDIPLQWDT
jgi:hypothetical protein